MEMSCRYIGTCRNADTALHHHWIIWIILKTSLDLLLRLCDEAGQSSILGCERPEPPILCGGASPEWFRMIDDRNVNGRKNLYGMIVMDKMFSTRSTEPIQRKV